MFRQTKNIDTAFRQMRFFTLVLIAACVLGTSFIVYKCFQLAETTQQKIFILANGKILEAFATERKEHIEVEARDHVKMFHHYFFTMDPDEKAIQTNITKALYLADASAKQQYDNLKENGYYTSLISANITQEIAADSIHIDINNSPIYFKYKGQQKIIRPTSVVIRSIITEGYLRNVSRSDNNPHGFLIERWRTIENKDIHIQNR